VMGVVVMVGARNKLLIFDAAPIGRYEALVAPDLGSVLLPEGFKSNSIRSGFTLQGSMTFGSFGTLLVGLSTERLVLLTAMLDAVVLVVEIDALVKSAQSSSASRGLKLVGAVAILLAGIVPALTPEGIAEGDNGAHILKVELVEKVGIVEDCLGGDEDVSNSNKGSTVLGGGLFTLALLVC
jgi:hypothetical protein